jgi:hypothetical protein
MDVCHAELVSSSFQLLWSYDLKSKESFTAHIGAPELSKHNIIITHNAIRTGTITVETRNRLCFEVNYYFRCWCPIDVTYSTVLVQVSLYVQTTRTILKILYHYVQYH